MGFLSKFYISLRKITQKFSKNHHCIKQYEKKSEEHSYLKFIYNHYGIKKSIILT